MIRGVTDRFYRRAGAGAQRRILARLLFLIGFGTVSLHPHSLVAEQSSDFVVFEPATRQQVLERQAASRLSSGSEITPMSGGWTHCRYVTEYDLQNKICTPVYRNGFVHSTDQAIGLDGTFVPNTSDSEDVWGWVALGTGAYAKSYVWHYSVFWERWELWICLPGQGCTPDVNSWVYSQAVHIKIGTSVSWCEMPVGTNYTQVVGRPNNQETWLLYDYFPYYLLKFCAPPTPTPSPTPTSSPRPLPTVTPTPRPGPSATPTPAPRPRPSPTPTPPPNAPTAAPTASSPRGCVAAAGTSFVWTGVPGASEYQMYVLKDNQLTGGSDIAFSYKGSALSITPPGGTLQTGIKYRWKVQAGNSAGFGPYSDNGQGVEFMFECGSVIREVPVPIGPTGCPIAPKPTISWQAVTMGATHYFLSIRDAETNQVFEFRFLPTSSYDAAGYLQRGHTYHWKVAARASNGYTGGFSSERSFCITPVPFETKPDLRTPAIDKGPCGGPAAVGRPVSVTSGNMYLDHVDIALPGIGPALVFSRSYNSDKRLHHGELGLGWNHAFEQRVTLATLDDHPDEQLTLTLGDGTAHYFLGSGGLWEPYVPASQNESMFSRGVGGTFVRSFRTGGSETYDPQGRLIRVTDKLGLSLTIQRATNGRIETITNASGRTLRFTHYPSGALQRIAGPGDLVTVDYVYYPQSFPEVNLKSVIYRDGSGYAFTYNEDYRLETVTDMSGRILEAHTYYADGRAATSSLAEGRENLTLQYEDSRTLVTDALGNVTTYEFAKVNHTRRVVRTTGSCSSCGGGGSQEQKWTYDTSGRVTSREDAPGKFTRYEYHSSTGDLLSVKDPLLNTTTYRYDHDGRVKTITTPENGTKAFVYGPAGPERITESITSRLSRSTRVEYDATTGLPKKTFDARGKATTYEYDPTTHELLAVRGPMNAPPKKPSARFEYDPMGRVKTVWDALDRPTSTTYDDHGRVKTVTYPDNTTADFGYDLGGRRTSATDALGRTASSVYDRFGRLEAIQDPLRNVTRQDYDLMSRLTALTDAEGRTTRFEYDGYGRMTRTVYPGGGIESRSYNQEGRLSSSTDRAGVTTTYVYDALGRLVRNAYSNQAPATSFEYDVMGRVKSMSKAGETLTWTYDHLGRMLTESSTSPTRAAATVSYTYDDFGNRLSVKLNDAAVATYTYDDASRLDLIRHESLDFDFGYDDASQRSSLSYPSGVLTTYDLSDMGRLERVDARKEMALVTDFQYEYDLIGNRTSKTSPELTEAYGYDALSRLTRVSRAGGVLRESSFSYDAVGNRLVDSSGGTVLRGEHNERNQLVAKDLGGIVPVEGRLDEPGQVQIDGQPARMLAGNRFVGEIATGLGTTTQFTVNATDGRTPVTKTYAFDVSGQPAAMTYAAGGNLISKTENGHVWAYEWTAENQLSRVLRDGVEVARFVYDPLGRRVAKIAGGVTTAWLYDGQGILRETVSGPAGTSTYLYIHGPGVDEPLAKKDVASGAMTYYHSDGLGSIVATTDAAGNVTSRRQYDAWGNLEVGASESGYAFTGREWDSETGLYYYRARYYDPKLAIFISEDPIGFGGGLNAYTYALGDPVNLFDPDGTDAWSASERFAGGLGGSAIGAALLKGSVAIATATGASVTAVATAGAAAVALVGAGSYQGTIEIQKLVLGIDPYTGAPLSTESRIDTAAGLVGAGIGGGLTGRFFMSGPRMCSTNSLRSTHGRTLSRREFQDLFNDIKANGIREPLLVVRHGGELSIVNGNHRWLIAQQLGISQVPVKTVKLPYGGFKTLGDLYD
jgi:RHS repeat-associated protein